MEKSAAMVSQVPKACRPVAMCGRGGIQRANGWETGWDDVGGGVLPPI
jgi:hypothetical protein